MRHLIKKFIIFLLIVSILIEPFAGFFPKASASEEDNPAQYDSYEMENFTIGDEYSQTDWEKTYGIPDFSKPQAVDNIETGIIDDNLSSNNGQGQQISLFDDIANPVTEPQIVLNSEDAFAVRQLSCLNGVSVDFENDLEQLFEILPDKLKPQSIEKLQEIKLTDNSKFYDLVSQARKIWGDQNKDFILGDTKSLECITGLSTNEIIDYKSRDPQYLEDYVDEAVSSLTIDIRVLKTLIYLVTPKDKGGAGHYRIKVARIRSGYTSKARQLSRESEYIRNMNTQNASEADRSVYGSLSDKTASEIGMSRDPFEDTAFNASDGETSATGEIEDSNGDTYDVYLTNQLEKEDQFLQELSKEEPNISAHADGKAIDISEIDDIRCTKIKKKRVGSDKKYKEVQRPIKLAWQTTDGYAESGGNDAGDLSTLFKSEATDSIKSLVEELGGDLSDYDGDLSQANFSDIVQLLGKSLFNQVLNSPSANFSGYNFSETIANLGSIYFADFLGLPREIFIGREINSLDDLQRVIGQAAIEKRLNLPFGTFEGNNLDGVLFNIGQRKLEYEMGLNTGDLNSLKSESGAVMTLAVGRALIEKTLQLQKSSFRGNNYSELKTNIGKYKGELVFADTAYTDNILHLDKGITEKLKKNEISPDAYASIVGKIRLDDTAYGFKYLAAHDSAYNLPEGTWDKALVGDAEALKTIGISTIARAFADSKEQKTAMTNWLISNTGKVTTQECVIPTTIEQTITTQSGETKTVAISEESALEVGLIPGDLYRMFACQKSNPGDIFERVGSKILYYAIISWGLGGEDGAKIDLMDTNPEARLESIEEVDFYLSRITEGTEIVKRIKNNWKDSNTQIDYEYIMTSLDYILGVLEDPSYRVNKDSMKDASRRIAVEMSSLKAKFQDKKKEYKELTNKINATIIDINKLSRIVSEIIAGESVPSSDTINIKQIPTSVFNSNTYTENKSVAGSNKYKNFKLDRLAVLLLLSRKLDPKTFFLNLGIDKAETELGLPRNSINYYIQNVEKKGMSGKDAFYEAIGQSRIEEEFGMPSYYFQGSLYKINNKPDFKNDIDELLRYNGITTDNKNYTGARLYVLEAKTKQPSIFENYVQNAEKAYQKGLERFTNSSDTAGISSLENNIRDVVDNVSANKLTDGIRSAESDLLFRMGLSGNLESLINDSPIAWSTADKKAKEIDRKFLIKEGTTRALFTGNFVALANGADILDKDDKKILQSAGLTPTALDKYLQALNGDIDAKDLKEFGQEIFYNTQNTYLLDQELAEASDQCPSPFKVDKNGIELSDTFVADTFGYKTKSGIKYFKNKGEAAKAKEKDTEKLSFLDEIALVFEQITGVNQYDIKNKLVSYLSDRKQKSLFDFDDEKMLEMEEQTGIPTDVLKKLFTREEATLDSSPLKAYKRAVGMAEGKRIISNKLLGSLGGYIDKDLFDSGDLYEVLNGNMEPIYELGGALIDQKFNLPKGTIIAVANAKTPQFQKCMIAEAGGNYLGSLVGLNYVSMQGDLFENFGHSKVEETLGLPRGSFKGANISELINNASPISFVIAFKIPTREILTDDILKGIFGEKSYKSIKNLSDATILKRIEYENESREFVPTSVANAMSDLDSKLRTRINSILNPNNSFWKDLSDNPDIDDSQLKVFLKYIRQLDRTFDIEEGVTQKLMVGEISPDDYRGLVANKTMRNMVYAKALDMFGMDDYQAKAALNLINNFESMVKNKEYGNIYTALSEVFEVNLDSKAGFDEGTISAIIDYPKDAPSILIGEGIKRLDESLGLNTYNRTARQKLGWDSDNNSSLSMIYERYTGDLAECDGNVLSADQEKQLREEELRLSSIENLTDDDLAAKADIKFARYQANEGYHACKKDARKSATNASLNTLKSWATDRVSEKIYEVTKGSISMPKEDIAEFISSGDMRYFKAAALSYAANIVVNKDGENKLVPSGMRISYDDILLGVFGDSKAEAAAEQAAVYAAVTGTKPNADDTIINNRFGDVCDESSNVLAGAVKCFSDNDFLNLTESPNNIDRNNNNLVKSNIAIVSKQYGYNSNDASANAAAESMYKTIYGSQIEIANSDACKTSPNSENCQKAFAKVSELNQIKSDARKESKKAFQEDLMYRSTDAMLWKMDENVYPGFSYAMMKGSAGVKQYAMATYIRNGIIRGELFGIDIGTKVPRVDEWLRAYNFFKDMKGENSLDNFFANKGGYSVVNGFINDHAEDWFGFELPDDMIGALAVGLSTGVWDAGKLGAGDTRLAKFEGNTYKGANGKINIPTLRAVANNFAAEKIFSWADKTFGWNVGTSYKIYGMYRKYSEARAAYIGAKTAKDAALIAKTKDSLNAAKADILAFTVNTVFSKQIAHAEETLGLVPGTGSMLVTMAFTGFNPLSIAMFVGYNLFGTYKIELKCSADGYYPAIESKPSSIKADVTDLGVWNGYNSTMMKQKSMEAAQYKAKRLIGDMLTMQESDKFEGIIPSQIMTGRQEDVDFWDNAITKYMCEKIGNYSVKGICGGNTKAGVWQNPQTVAVTHIGF